MEPTHPDRLVGNVTAPSAGGFPGPDGEVRLRMRLPFRTGSTYWDSGLRPSSWYVQSVFTLHTSYSAPAMLRAA
ncbi:MAG: hypothetical protein ACOX52_06865 [Verrucomicrobiota bacterium]|jgi:hypothetical protein